MRQELNLFKNFGFEIVNYFYIVTNTKKNTQPEKCGREHLISKIYLYIVKRKVGSSLSRDALYIEKSANSWQS